MDGVKNRQVLATQEPKPAQQPLSVANPKQAAIQEAAAGVLMRSADSSNSNSYGEPPPIPPKDRYVGEYCNGKRHGRGKLFFANGDWYEGEFRNGQMHGQGTFFISFSKNKYVGEFRDGKRHGQGILFFANGGRYEGQFLNNKRHGPGKFFYADRDSSAPPLIPPKYRYVGEYHDGKPHGRGKIIFANGNWYEGEFRNGQMHGRGAFFYASGQRYIGEYRNGQQHGRGTIFYASGNRYEGPFLKDQIHGRGTVFFANGDRYEGEFRNGQMHGRGAFFYANGQRYIGEYRNGQKHGRGTIFYADGNRYEGPFLNGQRHGQGTVFYADGDRYEGPFLNDQMHGRGKLFFANGDWYEGEFRNGQMHGRGTLFHAGANKFIGEFCDNKMHGKGTYTSFGGTTGELEFVNGMPISNISHISDSLFLQLLSQKFHCNAPCLYPLGIMSDYLITKGYNEVGHALKGAQQTQLFCTTPATQQTKAEEIYNRLQTPNQPVLLLLITTKHAIGLQMRQTVTGFIDFEIYNSGEGLGKFHKRHPNPKKKWQKFQTVWKRRVPIANLTPDQLKQFLGTFAKTDDAYYAICNLPEAQEIAEGEGSVIWQKEQKAQNCSLMWIFAYLKNNMTPQEYNLMCAQFFAKCHLTAKQDKWPNQTLIDSLGDKAKKLQRKTHFASH